MTNEPNTKENYVFGRPSNYSETIIPKMYEFFNRPLYRTVNREQKTKFGSKIIEVEVPNSMPTFEAFAIDVLGHSTEVFRDWKVKFPDFLQAYKACKETQKKFLVEHGLMGNYNSNFAKFIALNVTDLKDDPKDEKKFIQINIDKDDEAI